MSRLDLKYRPRKFSDVLGNEGVVDLLLKRSRSKTLSNQSMLFGGPKGTGKTTLARIVAMALVCQNIDDGEPCGVCQECASVLNETSVRVEELDAASQGTVDRIREMIRDSEYEPIGGIGNVYILDEAQRLSMASQDAMLKAVEDRSILVIMCTTEPHKIRASIRSRVEEYPVYAPVISVMTERLERICTHESISFEKEALEMLCRSSQNCPRICIRAIETMSVLGGVTTQTTKKFLRFDSYEIVDKILANIDSNPRHAISMFDDLADREGPTWIRDAMIFAVSSGMRVDVGAKHKYPCHITFFQTRLRRWSKFAEQLGLMEKPTMSGILSALMSTNFDSSRKPIESLSVPFDSDPPVKLPDPTVKLQDPPVKLQDPPVKLPDPPVKLPDPPTSIEVNGVKFSPSENLTTLDTKVILDSVKNNNEFEESRLSVEFRSDMKPMSDREFSRVFINRFKK